ncbi:MAG: hypothetical protein JXA20_01615 [Spirochaetes bacterium]|nr:hypothetical protein [Spirochaetota bacterium]
MATAALVLGIVTIVLVCVPGFNAAAFITGIIGVILGAVSYKNLKGSNLPTGIATGGLVTSIIGLSLTALIYISCFLCAAGTSCIACEMAKSCEQANRGAGTVVQPGPQKGVGR